MLRYKRETRPGLVALYDIRPGNGASQFLQPRSPHGAKNVLDRRHEEMSEPTSVGLQKPIICLIAEHLSEVSGERKRFKLRGICCLIFQRAASPAHSG